MSTVIMAACWPLTMSPSQKSVLISLADQASDDGVCWPAVGTISKRTCLSHRAVQDAIAWLESAGVITRSFRQNSSTSYTLRPANYSPEVAASVRMRKAKPKADRGANGAPHADGAPHANGAGGGAAAAGGGADGAPPEVQMAHPEPSLNRQGTAIEAIRPAAPAVAGNDKSGSGDKETELQAACRATWAAYSTAYHGRYGTKPVRNAQVNAKVKQFVQRIGYDEAPAVADFFVASVSESFVVKKCHDVGLLLNSAEAYRTQWVTGQAMTATRARQLDQSQSNYDAASEAVAIIRAKRGASHAG